VRENVEEFFIDSLRFKLEGVDENVPPRVGVDELKYVFNAISAQIRPELEKHLERVERAAALAGKRGFDYRPFRSWIESLPPIHQRLTFLRSEHERRVNNGELANDMASLTIGEVSEQSGVTSHEILKLESTGLLNPARSEGGQRRYSQDDVARIRELSQIPRDKRHVRSREVLNQPEPTASMSSASAAMNRSKLMKSEFSPSQVKDMTVATVAELYLEACEMFPNRDHSVIQYIQNHTSWLSADYIINIIRLARRRGIPLPVYRKGRLPKKANS